MYRLFLFIGLVLGAFFHVTFANYDTVNSSTQSCGDTRAVGWTIMDDYKECMGTQYSSGSRQLTWKCHFAGAHCSPARNNDQGPHCGYGSACMAHAGVGTCNLNNNWTWTSQTCRPRFSCLANASIDTTHAHILDPSELPNSFTLDHDYTYTLVDDDTPDKCEYVCDSGFTRDGNTCIPLVCSGQKPANAISCNNVIKAENFVPLQAGSLKTGFWRFDTFSPLPDTYTPNSNYLSGLVLPAPAVGSVPLYMFYRSPSLLYFGPLPYRDEVYYSTVPEAPQGMRIADDYKDGIVGYVYTSAAADRVPIYEFYDTTATHHLWSNAPVTGWTKLSPNTFVNSSDDTTVEYTLTKAVNISLVHDQSSDPEKNLLDNTQSINDGTAYFTITISNPDDSAPLNNISVIDAPVADCNKSVAQINTIMTAAIGNVKPNSSTSKNNILEPGESFSYNCSSKTLSAPFPNDETTATVNASTADTFKAPVTKVSAVTRAEYMSSSGINVAIIHDIDIAGETQDPTTQSINDGKAYFTVTVKNTGSTALKNVATLDADLTACSKAAAATATYMTAAVGNVKTDITVANGATPDAATAAAAKLKNNILEPGESYSYDCKDEAIKKTFPGGNKIVVSALTNDTFASSLTDEAVATLEYNSNPIIDVQIIHNQTADPEKNGSDDTQSINDGAAYFTVKVSNPVDSVALNNISLTDKLAPNCTKNAGNINTMLTTVNNVKTEITVANGSTQAAATAALANLKNNILEPGEYFSYDCSVTSLSSPFPNDDNALSTNAFTADTFKFPVTSSATTKGVYDLNKFKITVEIFNGNAFNPTTGEPVVPEVDKDKQNIIDGKAKFFVRLKNEGEVALKNINTTDTLAPTCGRTVAQINTLLTNIDKTTALGKNTQLDPGENIWYTCETQGVTFPGNINILQTMGTAVNSFATTVKDESNTLASYGDTPSVKIDFRSGAKNDFQNINATGVANFYVEISNNGFSPLDTISTTSLLAPSCNRTAAQIAQLIKAQGNKDAILDATGSEKISYTCSTSGVTYPNNTNTITVRATTVNTKNSDVPVFYGFDKNYNSKTVDTLDVPYSSLLASSIADDTYLFGNHPVRYNNVDSIYSCTDEVQCEWYCPAATPYYCSFTNSCVSSSAVCTPACGEGEYYCSGEDVCKKAGESCGALACNNNGTCDVGESCNCADCTNGKTDNKDHCGNDPQGHQMVCTRDIRNSKNVVPPSSEAWEAYSYSSSFIFLAKHPIKANRVAGKTFYIYNPERVILNMTKAQFLADPGTAIKNAISLPATYPPNPRARFLFNMSQLLAEPVDVQRSTINNLKSSILNRFLCSTDSVGAPYCHVNNLGYTYYPGFSYTPDGTIYGSIHDSDAYVQTTPYQRFGTFDLNCRKDNVTSIFYTPNTSPLTQGWTYWDGLGTAQNDGGKLAWQVNDANDGNGATIFKKASSGELADFMKKGGKIKFELKNLSSGTMASSDNIYHLLASYAEFTVGANVTRNGLPQPSHRYTLAFGMDTNRVPTVYALTDTNYSTNPTATPYKYTVTGGADKYNTYEMVYDPISTTVDIYVNGVERISNYPGNNVASANFSRSNGSVGVFFGSGSSAGIAKTNYGDISLTTNNDTCVETTPPPVVMTQVGACCPDGSQWDSDQNKCVVVSCGEGEYYCSAQKACISGSLPCNNGSVSLILGANNVTPTGAADCPASYSGGLCTTYWKVHVNFSEPFEGTPSVIVAPEKISDLNGCVGYQTDKVVAYTENISSTGFDLRFGGSPFRGTCGAWEGSITHSTAGWIALGKRASGASQKLVAQSEHNINLGGTSADCPGVASNHTCNDYWKRHITFATPFKVIPKVLVSGEHVSTTPGGATKVYRFYPENITTTGFDLRGGGYWNSVASANVGYVAIGEVLPENESTSEIISKAYTGSFTGSDGTCNGAYSGGLCMGSWNKDITFGSSFANSPQMFVSPKNSSDQGGCVGGATDAYYNTVSNITNLGFHASTFGSPLNFACGEPWDSGASISSMNWLALGTEESVVTCNNDGVCNGEESCNCADCNTKADHCALDGVGQQLLCMKNTAPAWVDVPLTSVEPFDSSCEYRFKRNFDPTSLGLSNASGDYWFYASAVFPSNIVETSHGGKVSHIYATSKTKYRVNGSDAAYTDIIISQMQKRCDEWADINPSTSETFGPLDEYRYKRSFDPTYYGLSNASGDYWYYISGVNQNNIIDTSDTSLISHMYAPSKTKYRVNGNDAAYTDVIISQMQKRNVLSGWTDVALDASSSYDSTCEYRFKRNFDPTSLGLSNASGDYWFYASAVSPSNIIENPQGLNGAQISHIYSTSKSTYRINGVPVSGITITQMQKRCNPGSITIGSNDQWIAYTYPGLASAYIYLTKLPAPTYTINGKTFIVYDPVKIIRGTAEADFLADPVTAIKNAPEVPIGATRNSRVLFNIAQLQSEDATTQNATIDALQSSVASRYLCTESMVDAGTCNTNSSENDVPSFGYDIGGNIFVSGSGNNAAVQYTAGQILGTFNVPITTSSLVFTGACCPADSAWNSTQNRCVPSLCGEGKFYCAAQKKCLNGGETCDKTVCHDDGVCAGDESCQCADCTNGGSDDKDKCSIISGVQALCSDDIPGDDKPGACCIPPKKWDSTSNSCTECTNTQAPSELKLNVDQPYINCTGGDLLHNYFKYKLTKAGGGTPYISDIHVVSQNNPILHPGFLTEGIYTVECFYGNAISVDTSPALVDSCTKTMAVKSDDTAQGCGRIYTYHGATLSNSMTDSASFDAKFTCTSRLSSTGIVNPFMIRFAAENTYLPYETEISNLLNGLALGSVSKITNIYTVPTGSTDISCAVKIGTGYSTNSACTARACVGADCLNHPDTFSVVSSGTDLCTSQPNEVYNIGCNPNAPQATQAACANWFSGLLEHARTTAGSMLITNFDARFTFNGANDLIHCTQYAPGSMPGGLNMYENFVCTKTLSSGQLVEIFAADDAGTPMQSLQTTAYTTRLDTQEPHLDLKYYKEPARINLITDIDQWQKGGVTAEAVCTDLPNDESVTCACAPTIDPTTTDAGSWSAGIVSSAGADVMSYIRTFAQSLPIGSANKVFVWDTAHNKSTSLDIVLGIDAQTPTVSVTGTSSLSISASDDGAKIWPAGIITKTLPLANISNPGALFDASCGIASPTYAKVADTAALPTTQNKTVAVSGTQVVNYCVQDNAGNVTRGIYPSAASACFSASNMNPIPNTTTYKDTLLARINPPAPAFPEYGYSFSENSTNAACFRGILSNNITTLVTNQYEADMTTATVSWASPAFLKNTNTSNTNGYYYFRDYSVSIDSFPTTISGPKAVIVEGGNIQINTDITNYDTGTNVLILIARKNTTTNTGGNIYINPSVTRIDAIIIADGAIMNADATGVKNWIDDTSLLGTPLRINGRLYSFNTRGGSLTPALDDTPATPGKYFVDSTLTNDNSSTLAASMDLERFRIVQNGTDLSCSLSIAYRLFTSSTLPALLKRPINYTSGVCSF